MERQEERWRSLTVSRSFADDANDDAKEHAKEHAKIWARFWRNYRIKQRFKISVVIFVITEGVALFMLGLAIHP